LSLGRVWFPGPVVWWVVRVLAEQASDGIGGLLDFDIDGLRPKLRIRLGGGADNAVADVLFDVGKYDLRPTTREKLARLGGIVLAHKGLQLDIEGHTDSTGSDELNQTLSERRAMSVQMYMNQQGLAPGSVTAKGFGKSMPVADNSTSAGRQQNRRVEIIVSGEVIGAKIGK